MTTIGERIKQRRNELRWSQRELSDRMGYSNHSTITKIEAGKVDLNQTRIAQFAEVLNTTPAYLMGWEDEEKEKPAISSERERLIKQANELLGRYSEEDLAWVLQMLERVPPSEK